MKKLLSSLLALIFFAAISFASFSYVRLFVLRSVFRTQAADREKRKVCVCVH